MPPTTASRAATFSDLGLPADLTDALDRAGLHTPFPIHGMDDAMGIRGTRLPFLVLAGGMAGTALALLMQWLSQSEEIPLVDEDYAALKRAMDAARVPWTPGRGIQE